MNEQNIFDLEAAIKVLAGKFVEIDSIYIFGSRRYNTGSTRSDIDILLEITSPIKPSKLRDFTLEYGTALDLFVLENGRATSVANESFIEAQDNQALINQLNAMLLYDKKNGSSGKLLKQKKIEIDRRVSYEMTALPNGAINLEVFALRKYFAAARENGLTAKPYLGATTEEASEFVIEIIKNLPNACNTVTNHGEAKNGWTRELKSEYDFQNLFWIVVKPWLPNLSREQTALKYDNQDKKSDFSLFNDQLVIELKHIKDDGDKRETVKTLEGLKSFYEKHPNIRVLIFAILVDKHLNLDDKKWEADFSYPDQTPTVRTILIRNN